MDEVAELDDNSIFGIGVVKQEVPAADGVGWRQTGANGHWIAAVKEIMPLEVAAVANKRDLWSDAHTHACMQYCIHMYMG